MKIATDRRRNEVVLRLDPEEARIVADHLDGYGNLPDVGDLLAVVDTADLREAADRIAPLPEQAP